ncbi:MAG: hypothetical protein KZQ58_07260 [gamma proteobacterium symbiont of Bathyaustriella thionipta]|nr:hypothetical protein [gamma proteobacterium symbiont of Bathyaustriella thionipta]
MLKHRRPDLRKPYSGHELKVRLRHAVILAGIAMLCLWPLLYFNLDYLNQHIFKQPADAEQITILVFNQLLLAFLLALLCSLTGFLYAERLGLPGIGRTRSAIWWLLSGLVAGSLFTPLTYWAYEQTLLTRAMGLYPTHWPQALLSMLGESIMQEVTLRFGLLTMGIYFLARLGYRHPWPVIALISAFSAYAFFGFLERYHLLAVFTLQEWSIALVIGMLLQWLLCEVYLRWGLLASISLHSGLLVKYLLYSMIWAS